VTLDSSTLVTGLIGLSLFMLAWFAQRALKERWHPAVFFPAIWGVILWLVIAAASLGFFGVQPQTALLFLFGALVFVLGAVVGNRLALATTGPPAADPWDRLNYRPIAWGCLLLHMVMLPVTWFEMVRIAEGVGDLISIAFNVRVKTVAGLDNYGPLVGNYLVLSFIIVPVLAMGAFRGHLSTRMAVAAGLPWLFIDLVASGRSALVGLTLVLAYLRATQAQPVNLRLLLLAAVLFMLMFGGGVILVSKGDTKLEDGFAAVVNGVLTNLADYALQGPVLFSRYLNGEIKVVSSWDPLVFPCQVLQAFGMCKAPEQHQEFAEFGRFDQFGNVYTIYFSVLPKYGPMGMVLLLLFYGAWTAWHHRRHQQHKSLAHSLIAANLFAAICISVFSDAFGPNLNFLIKTAIVAALLQKFASKHPNSATAAIKWNAAT
jgi:oligosaccharide repeat unit polymerase